MTDVNPQGENPNPQGENPPPLIENDSPTPETVEAEPVAANDTNTEPVELDSGNKLGYDDNGNTYLETPDGSRYQADHDLHDLVVQLSKLYPNKF